MAAVSRNANLEWIELPDCESLLENGRCASLRVASCAGSTCAFFQPRGTRRQADARLRALDEAEQERIAQRYYGGRRPWLIQEENGSVSKK